MKDIRFEWDSNKEQINITKHGITFAEAATAFADEQGIIFDDPDHSENEDRFILLGLSTSANLLIVCHCYRGEDEIIRIISARQATKHESKQYSDFNKGV